MELRYRVLLAAGSNAKGQLGIGSDDDAHTFTPCRFAECEPNQLPDLTSTVVDIACGANHTVLLLEHLDGSTTLWGSGDGRRGQLGPHRSEDSATWTTFHKLILPHSTHGYTHRHIAAGWETTYIVLSHPESSDILLSMGSNDFGALGAGEGTDGGGSTRTSHGEPRIVDFGHLFPENVPRMICIRSLHAGPRHVVAQLVVRSSDDDRSALAGWGASRHGQLGKNGVRFAARPVMLPIDIHEDPMVSCGLGNQHTVVLHASGRISALGSNKQGQIPSIGLSGRICSLGCTWNGTYMETINGDKHVLLSTGNNAQGQLGRSHSKSASAEEATIDLPRDRVISSFVCGSEHVLVSLSDSLQQGTLVLGWGWNEHGNMGLGSLDNVAIPTQLWPGELEMYRRYPQKVTGIWAGCATSWLLVE